MYEKLSASQNIDWLFARNDELEQRVARLEQLISAMLELGNEQVLASLQAGDVLKKYSGRKF